MLIAHCGDQLSFLLNLINLNSKKHPTSHRMLFTFSFIFLFLKMRWKVLQTAQE